MPKLQQRDFYFGAALSQFFRYNNDAKPSLIESIDNNTQIIKMLTDTSKEFYVFMKYTASAKLTKNEQLTSWAFQLSEKDKKTIQECLDNQENIYIFLICGLNSDCKGGEVAIIKPDEYREISHKNSITINQKGTRPKVFNLHKGKAQSETFPIARNRIEKKLELI